MFLRSIRLKPISGAMPDYYPFSIPAIQNLTELSFHSDVTFFCGENGSGKSTLLEAIAFQCGFHTAGGSRHNRYEVHASNSDLGEHLQLSWLPRAQDGFFFRAESFYQFASHIDEIDEDEFKSYGGKSLHHQSHGESFLSLFTNRLNGRAIYLLDEPEAALSPQRQLALLRVIYDLTKEGGAQFIIATHSPILLGYPGASIRLFEEGEIVETEYENTEHYSLTKYFLQNRERLLAELFKEEE
ncbi:AAA family ATPase [Bacillus sp. SJS]|uniref:AAA family ATPase n=1 Tax=Bacillus sp. SJS TaxID=1423321 RepID=UPI0004DCCB1F|nr:AAA family ATPase [Bacillus sp. SJS]KZZ83458.1 AAA family ATPase [Bacillus sp. SJS]